MREQIQSAAEYILRQFPSMPQTALVLGSGLGGFAETLAARTAIDTRTIPHYPAPSVEGHRGQIVVGSIGGVPLLILQGRIHFYETNSIDLVLFPILVLREMGIRSIILTNAAGGINPQLEPGDLMVVTDQINLTGLQTSKVHNEPLPHQSVYDEELVDLLLSVAGDHGITVKQGVYAGVKGPSYETAAEIEMIRKFGGDAVGMSTVLEAMAASRLGMKVLGISCITNKATGLAGQKLNHREVTEVADRVKGVFTRLLTEFISALGKRNAF